MPTYHIVNGDSLAKQLQQTSLQQNIIVCRECFIEGNVAANNIAEFWQQRAAFIAQAYHATEQEYYTNVVAELEKISSLPDNAEICLWFGNDLFCQVNMWFVVFLLSKQSSIALYRVFPPVINEYGTCSGFAASDASLLEKAYSERILFSPEDIALGSTLWRTYQQNDMEKLKILSTSVTAAFQHLEAVCQAHIDRFPQDGSIGRPERVIQEICQTTKDFKEVFAGFSRRESVYGFSDMQVRAMYHQQNNIVR